MKPPESQRSHWCVYVLLAPPVQTPCWTFSVPPTKGGVEGVICGREVLTGAASCQSGAVSPAAVLGIAVNGPPPAGSVARPDGEETTIDELSGAYDGPRLSVGPPLVSWPPPDVKISVWPPVVLA